jgi:hypothetical protein
MNVCRVCGNKLLRVIRGQFTCRVGSDHKHYVFLNANGKLESEEITVYEINNNIGYYVSVSYECNQTWFATIESHGFRNSHRTNSVFSLDDFDRQKFMMNAVKLRTFRSEI